MARALALMLLLLGAGTAWAQPAPAPGEPETVYSDARRLRDEQLSRRFVQSLLRPSASLEGQFSRWKDPICLNTYGLRPTAAYVIEQRIRKVADLVGAPVERTSPCTPNIGIIVTPDPQASLDSIAATRAFLLQGGNQKPVSIEAEQGIGHIRLVLEHIERGAAEGAGLEHLDQRRFIDQ